MDDRGAFQELWRVDDISKELGREVVLRQGNLSVSQPHVLRGFHAEPQDKIVTPLTGKIMAAIADIREDSKTFGRVETIIVDNTQPLSSRTTLFVSNGLANSFCVMGDEPVHYVYAVSSAYNSEVPKRAVRWNDPDLGVEWPYSAGQLVLSQADQKIHY